MRRLEYLVIVLGLGFSVYVMSGVIADNAQQTQAPEVSAVAAVPTAAATTAPPAPEVVEIVVPPPSPPSVDGLSGAISDVLGSNGHTELITRSSLEQDLPPAVVAVLIANEAVLRLVEPEQVLP